MGGMSTPPTEPNEADAEHPDAGDGAQQPSTPGPTGNPDPQTSEDEAKAKRSDKLARERKYQSELGQAKQKRAGKWRMGCLVFLGLGVLGQIFQAAGISGGGRSLPADVRLMNDRLGRGRKHLTPISMSNIDQASADVDRAKREGWCITGEGCRDDYVCGLPNAIGLTTSYTEEFTGPMGVRRAAQGGSRITERTIIAHICSTPYCLKETKAAYRSMINRMKQSYRDNGSNVTIDGPWFRVRDL